MCRTSYRINLYSNYTNFKIFLYTYFRDCLRSSIQFSTIEYKLSRVWKEKAMDPSSSSSDPECMNPRKVNLKGERARRASETVAEKEQLLLKPRERDRARREAEGEEQKEARLQRKRTQDLHENPLFRGCSIPADI